jgi:hypothetical protein
MATENNILLTTSWQEIADGSAVIVMVSGALCWINNGASAPTDDSAYFPLTAEDKSYFYPGIQKTFAKIPDQSEIRTILSPTEV